MEAVVWCLWGDTLRGLASDEVINRRVGRNCAVTLDIEDAGSVYSITRTRAAGGKKPNDLRITVNGADVSQGVNADTQAFVNTVVGMDCRTFTQSVLLSAGSRSFSEMTDKEQKSVLEDILRIDTVSKAQAVAKRKVNEAQATLAGLRTELSSLHKRHDGATTRAQGLAKASGEYAENALARRMKLVKQKAQVEQQIEDGYRGDGLDILLEALGDVDERLAELSKKGAELAGKLLSTSREYADRRSGIRQVAATASGHARAMKAHVDAVCGLAGKACPTCRQYLDPNVADEFLNDNSASIEKFERLIAEASANEAALAEQEREAVKGISELRDALARELQSTSDQYKVLQERVQKRQSTLQLIVQYEQQSFNLSEQLRDIDDTENPYGVMLAQVDEEIAQITSAMKSAEDACARLDHHIKHLLFWDRGFGNQGLKSYMIDGVLPFLNKRAQYYADIMSGGDLQVSFATQRQLKSGAWKEEFQVHVVNRQGADVYAGNSAGEKRRSDIAVGWALGDLAAARAKKSINLKLLLI
jgi:DNA repair exonuclease SbcCD ATPase subunit